AAGVEPDLREVECFFLVGDVAARDVELLLLAAQFEIGARHFGGDDDQRVAALGLDRAELGIARLEATPYAAEDIELPECVEPRVVVLERARLARDGVRVRRARLRVAAIDVDGGR